MNGRLLFAGLLLALVAAGCGVDPEAAAAEFYQQGRAAAEAGDLESARIHYWNALQNQPGNSEIRLSLVDIHRRLGDHGQAVAELREVVSSEPDNVKAALELGTYYLQPEWYAEAQRLAEKVLASEPGNLEARLLKANARLGQGETEAGIAALNEILETDPDHLATLLTLGLTHDAAGDRVRGLQTLQAAVSRHPDSSATHRALAEHHLAAADFARAEPPLLKAFELEPLKHWPAVASLYFRTDRESEAETFLDRLSKAYPQDRQVLFAVVELLQRQGRAIQAVERLERSHAVNSEDDLTGLRLAELYLESGRIDDARPLVAAAAARGVFPAETGLVQARLLSVDGKVDEALAQLDRTLEQRPGMQAGWLLKARLLFQERKLAAAQQSAREAARFPTNAVAAGALLAEILEAAGRPDEAVLEADRVLQRDGSNRQALQARGAALLTLGRIEAARTVYEKLVAEHPGDAYNTFRLGTIDAAQGRRDVARRRFEQALAIDASFDVARQALVRLKLEARDLDGALGEIDRLYTEPNRRHARRAEIRIAQGDLEAAEAEIRAAIKAQPDDWNAHLRLAGLRLTRGDVQSAIREADALIAADPRSVAAHVLKAYYLHSSGDVDGAIDYYNRTLRLDVENPMAANNLAFLYAERSENLSRALMLAQMVRRADPENPEYADTLGWVLYKMGNHELAVDQLRFAVNSGRPSASHYFRLGMAYRANGQLEPARESFIRALELDPSFPEAAQARRQLAELGK